MGEDFGHRPLPRRRALRQLRAFLPFDERGQLRGRTLLHPQGFFSFDITQKTLSILLRGFRHGDSPPDSLN